MVIGEPLGGWIITRTVNVAHAASVCLVGERYDKQPGLAAQSAELDVHRPN
jgi:hypothetical protein